MADINDYKARLDAKGFQITINFKVAAGFGVKGEKNGGRRFLELFYSMTNF